MHYFYSSQFKVCPTFRSLSYIFSHLCKTYFPPAITAKLFISTALILLRFDLIVKFISSKSQGRNDFYAAHTCSLCGQYVVCDVILRHLLWCRGKQNRKTTVLLSGMLFVNCVSLWTVKQTSLDWVGFNFKLQGL